MQVVYTEMTRDEAKSNLAKWNLIDGVQFNHMKNYLMFKQCTDLVCFHQTLDIIFIVRDGMEVVWHVSKGNLIGARYILRCDKLIGASNIPPYMLTQLVDHVVDKKCYNLPN